MLQKIVVFLCAFLASGILCSQDGFHRLFPARGSKQTLVLTGQQLRDGNFVTLELELNPLTGNPLNSDTLYITKYEPKGDVMWSNAISFDASLEGIHPSFASISDGDKDSLYFSVITRSTTKPSKVIGALGSNGGVAWVNAYSTTANQNDGNNYSHLLQHFKKSLFTAHSGGSVTQNDILISRKSTNGSNLWSKLITTKENNADVSERVNHIGNVIDSTIFIAGSLDIANLGAYLTNFDTLGNIVWGRKYRTSNPSTMGRLNTFGAVTFTDTTYAVAGTITGSGSNSGFVVKTDRRGRVVWSKQLKITTQGNMVIKSVGLDRTQNILVAGTNQDQANGPVYPFVAAISYVGEVLWVSKINRVNQTPEIVGKISGTTDKGSIWFSNVLDNNRRVTSFLKLDDKGLGMCDTSLTKNIISDINIVADTLVWTSSNSGNRIPVTNVTSRPNNYDVPVVALQQKRFCKQEPKIWKFTAKTQGAVNYKWSREVSNVWVPIAFGATRDTVTVFALGKYAVEVTIDEKVCYKLCDTVELTEYELPMATIQQTLGNFCTNDKITLVPGYQPGHPDIKSISWSTGQTTNTIEVGAGSAGLTIIDQCNEIANATINVVLPRKLTAATVTGNLALNCLTGLATGTLSAGSNSSGLPPDRYRWSTGQATKDISLNDVSGPTFTVTVTDFCNTSAAATYTVPRTGQGIQSAQITVSREGICVDKSIRLNGVANRTGQGLKYIWSEGGATTPSINVSKAGTYAITITDACNNTATASQSVTEEDLTPKDLRYANVFFPEGVGQLTVQGVDSSAIEALKLNRTFGPANLPEFCLESVQDYQFYVFNRWGQQVFESRSVGTEWDGTQNDKESPTDTYIWVVKYNVFGFEKKLKGDVNLIRP